MLKRTKRKLSILPILLSLAFFNKMNALRVENSKNKLKWNDFLAYKSSFQFIDICNYF